MVFMSLSSFSRNFLPPPDSHVVVGMSGGVDSSVAALLLKEHGCRVTGLFMKNWDEVDEDGQCNAEADYEDVARVCESIGIPYYSTNFTKEYWDQVFVHFVKEYEAGRTPNPDILCNREIKFDAFLKKAVSFGADYLATGHYARIFLEPSETDSDVKPLLAKGVDSGKDQTYFIHAIHRNILKKVSFPIGHLQKSEVREIAKKHGLSTHAKKDSTGICFIGERKFRDFLSRYVAAKPGEFRNLDGTVVGRHRGSAFYTIGQRRGLGLGGDGPCWYVIAKDVEKNIVFVERGDDHPSLYKAGLKAKESSWIDLQAPMAGSEVLKCRAKIRHRQADQNCQVRFIDESQKILQVDFDQPQRAVAPGQSIVFYQDDICLGGAVIDSAY